jgi:hypothetical protein
MTNTHRINVEQQYRLKNASATKASTLLVLLIVALIGATACTTGTASKPSTIGDSREPAIGRTAGGAQLSTSLQQSAIERSKARWALLLSGKYEATFSFLTPASQKGMTAADYGRRMSNLRFRSAEVVSATCDGDVCTVNVQARIGQLVPRVGEVPHEFPIEERWVQVDGVLGLIRR